MKYYTRILVYIVLLFFAVGFLQIVGALMVGVSFDEITGSGDELTLMEDTIISYFGLAGTIALFFFAFQKIEEISIPKSFFSTHQLKRDTLLAVITVVSIIGIGTAILLLSNQISLTPLPFDGGIVLTTFLLFVSVSIQEELFCRGLIQKTLMRSIPPYTALIVASFLFALLHAFNPNFSLLGFINLTLSGVLLGLVFMHTENLWFCFVAHLIWNFIQAPFLGFNVSGNEIQSITQIQLYGPTYLTGGKFGYEGSILCTTLSVIAIFILDLYFRKRNKESVRLSDIV